MRATFYSLMNRVYTLNHLLDKPSVQFASGMGEPVKFSVGYIALTHDANGYTLEEQVSEAGAVHVLIGQLTAHEMDVFLDGIMKGMTLWNTKLANKKD